MKTISRQETDLGRALCASKMRLAWRFACQVHASEENVWCRTEVIYRPQQPAPAAVYARLGPQRMQLVRRAAMLGLWARDAGRKIAAALDRTNAIGVVDCMLVGVFWCRHAADMLSTWCDTTLNSRVVTLGSHSGVLIFLGCCYRISRFAACWLKCRKFFCT